MKDGARGKGQRQAWTKQCVYREERILVSKDSKLTRWNFFCKPLKAICIILLLTETTCMHMLLQINIPRRLKLHTIASRSRFILNNKIEFLSDSEEQSIMWTKRRFKRFSIKTLSFVLERYLIYFANTLCEHTHYVILHSSVSFPTLNVLKSISHNILFIV